MCVCVNFYDFLLLSSLSLLLVSFLLLLLLLFLVLLLLLLLLISFLLFLLLLLPYAQTLIEIRVWLKSLRLHKYSAIFEVMNYNEMVNLTDAELEKAAHNG